MKLILFITLINMLMINMFIFMNYNNNPLMMMISLLIYFMNFFTLILMKMNSSFFPMLIFLIMLSGMMILIMYFTSLSNNNKFTLKKTFIKKFFSKLMIVIIMMINLNFMMMKFEIFNNFSILTFNQIYNSSMTSSMKMFSFPIMYISIMVIFYLWFSLTWIVKITLKSNFTLRKLIYEKL